MPTPSRADSAAQRPRPSTPRAARSRPSAQPVRWALGATAIAALTVIGAGLVRFPVAADDPVASVPRDEKRASPATGERPVRYVRLKPGQKAPKGARVIREAAPTPRVVVRRVTSPAQQPSVRSVTRTKQSG